LARKEYEGIFGEFGNGDAFAASERMRYRQSYGQIFAQEHAVLNARMSDAGADEGRLGAPVQEGWNLLVSGHLVQLELDGGVSLAHFVEHGRQDGEHGGSHEGDGQHAAAPVGGAMGFIDGGFGEVQQLPGATLEGDSGRSKLYMAARPLQKRYAEFLFKLLDGAAEGWLREMEAQRGASEVEFFGDGDEAADLTKFHVF
jgi:hypothetical protein